MRKHQACILTVDDDPAIHGMMDRILRQEGHAVLAAHSGNEALGMVQDRLIDLIILDLAMPGMDGFQVAAALKGNARVRHIPVLLFTENDSVNPAKALDAGVDDFVSKTADPAVIKARVRAHLRIKRLNDRMREQRRGLEDRVAMQTRRLKDASLETIFKLSAASEYRDQETGAHIKRMSHYAATIARTMGLRNKTVEAILYSAPMHDIGKMGIPDRILLKPGPLNAEEWHVMKRHPEIGAKILEEGQTGFLQVAETIALTHHEKWDGTGYPRGLRGTEIPVVGQVTALADVFDALTSTRPYKMAVPGIEAIRIIQEGRDTHFAPKVVDAFFTSLDEILAIRERFRDRDSNINSVGEEVPGLVRPGTAATQGVTSPIHVHRISHRHGQQSAPPQAMGISSRLFSWLRPGNAT